MTVRGAGDRWMSGEKLPGVTFGLNDAVEVTAGAHAGTRGTILFLVAIHPEPVYLVELGAGKGDARLRQASLRHA